ncbi:protein of unknown function [Methylorubrum extorquens DM4]|jgi:hypothetical protein|uniref:Uncharacterized protein n=2 Tax=Methylorubrum extorquens TaxID=408 RepID=C7CAU5_METED|nr:protein of unknown function [Methylorubrum extorquens DM4]
MPEAIGATHSGKEIVMSYTDVSPTTARQGYFLDVAPMISALQFQPTDFEFSHGWLQHIPSRHRFKFDKKGQVTIDARCDCSGQSIKREQGDPLFQAFTSWRQYYWQPMLIDREFASHFKTPNAWVRLLRDVRMAWRRFRHRAEPVSIPAEAMAMVPAE